MLFKGIECHSEKDISFWYFVLLMHNSVLVIDDTGQFEQNGVTCSYLYEKWSLHTFLSLS